MYIGIDLGGTNIAAGIVDKTGKIIAKDSVPTLNTRPIEAIMLDMTKLCKTLLDKSQMDINKIEAVGIGCPGTVDNKNGIISYSNIAPYPHRGREARLGQKTGIDPGGADAPSAGFRTENKRAAHPAGQERPRSGGHLRLPAECGGQPAYHGYAGGHGLHLRHRPGGGGHRGAEHLRHP